MDADVVRQLVSSALAVDGPSGKGRLASDPRATMFRPGGELPGGIVLGRFDAFPHPGASFYVGIVDRQVFYLTETPEAFVAMVRASGLRIGAPEVAIAMARAYIETTRSMREFGRVVDRPQDLTWPAPRSPEHEHAIAEAIARLRTLIRPPAFEAVGDGHKVTLFVLRGSVLERRTLTISRDGDITERVEQVESGLPTPITI